jgi:hypothetical protein
MKFPSLKKNVIEKGEHVNEEIIFNRPEYLETAA